MNSNKKTNLLTLTMEYEKKMIPELKQVNKTIFGLKKSYDMRKSIYEADPIYHMKKELDVKNMSMFLKTRM